MKTQLATIQPAKAGRISNETTPTSRMRLRVRLGLLLALSTLALAACQEGQGILQSKPQGESTPKAQTSTRIVDRDVEAPEVFQVTDTALWDGRPSLGGVWVASPDATDPERVIMRNPANGKFVIGALFKREIDNPGPKLQISSDTAEALGILAGQPMKLSVTALRREEAPETRPATPILDSNEAIGAAPPVASAPAAAPVSAGAIDGGGVSTKPLDAPKGAAPKSASATAAVAAAALAPAAQAPAPAASGSGRPIQIGFFSVEANAKRASETLAKAGITTSLRKEAAKGKDYWSVTARGDGATLSKIKAAGFADAYLLK